MRSGARNIRAAFTSSRLTHFGGVYLFHRFLQQLQLRTYLSMSIPYPQRNNRYTLSEIILALIYPMILGLEKIEVSALLKTNGVFQYITGLPSFPDPTTLRRFLTRASPELLARFEKTHNDLRKHFLAQPLPRSRYWIDFDSTAQTLYGHQEGVVKGYNPGHRGKKSYHPLVATEAHLRDALGGFLRPGNAHTAEGVIPLLHEVISLLPITQGLRVRADAGFYEKDFVGELDGNGIEFAIVARMTQPVKNRVAGIKYHAINRSFSTSEFSYQPHGWKRSHRFVVLRRKVEDDPEEKLTLFTLAKYAYSVIITNLSLTPYGVFTFYKDRAGLERIIRVLKNDFPFGSAPTGNFEANALYAELSLFAYNLVTWFKRLCLPQHWQSFTLPTLRHRVLMIPAQFTRTGNVPTLKFQQSYFHEKTFEFIENRIKRLDPLV